MYKESFKHLKVGQPYTIARRFVDYYGIAYSIGEVYTYLGHNFLPYEDGLTLHFSQAFEPVRIYLQWREETQADIINHLEDYFFEVASG